MAKHGESDVSALVVPRSVSGRSIRELQQGPLPPDLSPYRATPENMQKLRKFFEQSGFRVFEEALGLTLTIEGSEALFEKTFHTAAAHFQGASGLQPPAEVSDLIERVSLIPAA